MCKNLESVSEGTHLLLTFLVIYPLWTSFVHRFCSSFTFGSDFYTIFLKIKIKGNGNLSTKLGETLFGKVGNFWVSNENVLRTICFSVKNQIMAGIYPVTVVVMPNL